MRHRLTKLVYLLAALTTASCVLASGGKQPFSVTLAPPNKPLKTGTELVLQATIKNTSGHDMAFPTSLGQVPPDGFRYKIEVLYDHGWPAPPAVRVLERRKLENEAKKERKPLLPVGLSNTLRRLKPGQSFVDEINVSHYYNLTKPGLYTIWVIRPLPPDLLGATPRKLWKGSVRSNTITVTVKK